MQLDHAAAEAALVEQLELDANVVGSAGLPPPTTIGLRKRWYSSTRPALIASAGEVRTADREVRVGASLRAAGSRRDRSSRSIRVLSLETDRGVVEKTTLSAARQIWA